MRKTAEPRRRGEGMGRRGIEERGPSGSGAGASTSKPSSEREGGEEGDGGGEEAAPPASTSPPSPSAKRGSALLPTKGTELPAGKGRERTPTVPAVRPAFNVVERGGEKGEKEEARERLRSKRAREVCMFTDEG